MNDKTITLRYEGIVYQVIDEWTDDADPELIHYMWMEGNYACDCNRARFIYEQHETAPDELAHMPCGMRIQLLDHWAFDTGYAS